MMKVVVLLALCAATVSARSAIPYGHAAYVYPPQKCSTDACAATPSCNKAAFAADISNFNKAAGEGAKISKLLTYGGDVEFWPDRSDPQACWAPAKEPACNVSVFYDPTNEAAAQTYSKAHDVQHVVALIDGRMDGWEMIQTYNDYEPCKFGDFYPDLKNLTDSQLKSLATDIARLYCETDLLSGVQIDLEPYKEPYSLPAAGLVAAAATALRDEDMEYNCRNEAHPNGRSVSYFTFAHSQNHQFTKDVLGDNGYYVFSLYDLQPKPEDGGFMYNTPQEFKDKMRYEMNFIPGVVETDGHFTLAIPIAASCHEYEEYVPMSGKGCGPACTPETNTAKMIDYVNAAFDVLEDPETTANFGGLFCMNETAQSQFVGLSFWVWTHEMSYPPMKWFSNNFLPVEPPADVQDAIRARLPALSNGTTCAGNDCTASTDRPNGCPCDHSWDCKSDYCTGICTKHPDEWLHTPPKSWARQYGHPLEHRAGVELLSRVGK